MDVLRYGMGNRQRNDLPRYVAVQVSAERWRVAEVVPQDDPDGWQFPAYSFISKPLSFGACNNELTRLQGEDKGRRPEEWEALQAQKKAAGQG